MYRKRRSLLINPSIIKTLIAIRVKQIRAAYASSNEWGAGEPAAVPSRVDNTTIRHAAWAPWSSKHSAAPTTCNILPNHLSQLLPLKKAESFTTVAPASVGHNQLKVMSHDTFIQAKGEDEYYFAYGDVSQIWKRQMKSTGRMVAIKGFRVAATAGVGDVNEKFQIALLELAAEWGRGHINVSASDHSKVSQLWKRQTKLTGQLVANEGFIMTQPVHVDELNKKYHIALRQLARERKILENKHGSLMACSGVTLDFGLIASVMMLLGLEENNVPVNDRPAARKLGLSSQVASAIAYLHLVT
ncbi:hypothetical protein HWV62_34651 [Athelia sp. TMB]|nr:hypothetical protein HWV62_34651 [Athelia sp. TMB]